MKIFSVVFLSFALQSTVMAQESAPTRIEKITSDDASIALHLFIPNQANAARSAIVLFHGGGWSEGDALWVYGQAERFQQLGLLAVAVDYRLSDQQKITPFDAVADARNTIRWLRQHAATLKIDPHKIVALGTSAGGHIAASAAVFNEPYGDTQNAQPDALILRSAAIAPSQDGWFRQLTGGPAQANALSPVRHIHAQLPATLILQGEKDNMAPAQGAITFCERMRAEKNICELEIYPGVGHLFTRNLQNQEIPDYDAIDQDVVKKSNERTLAFLKAQGFLAN